MSLLTFVNHASVVVATDSVRLLCDPWLEGRAFNNGWDLIAPSQFTPDDFRTITHIWFSHEHPDHFYPPSLKKVPEDARPRIEVLYQTTRDRKVLDYCAKLGFRTRALTRDRCELAPDFHVTCGPVPFYDSWLFIEAGGQRILNLNDCQINSRGDAAAIRRQTGPVDLLLTQFSYAAYKADPDDHGLWEEAARIILDRVIAQTVELAPRFVVPFASFVYFCHDENRWMNRAVNTPAAAARRITAETKATPVVLYPGDRWEVGTPHDNAPALERWAADYAMIPRALGPSRTIALADLERLGRTFVDRVRRKNNRLMLVLGRWVRFFRPVVVRLWDLNQTVSIDLRHGVRPAAGPEDASMGSDSLGFVLEHEWGLDTLIVNGRFRATPVGFSRMMRLFGLSELNNTGRSFGPGLLFDRVFTAKAARMLRRLFPARGLRPTD